MAKRNIVVIGASAGGVTALKQLVRSLPADFPASVFVVQHLAPYTKSLLPDILTHVGALKAVHPADGDSIEPGRIYVAPPDHHILIEDHHILVKKGPKENRFRPSIDALFRSAAYTFGSRVIGVVLTGLLNDGTSGMWTVKRLGGVGVIQEPDDAEYPSMPESVLEYVEVEHVVPLSDIGPLLCRLTGEEAPGAPELSAEERDRIQTEIDIAAQDNGFEMGIIDKGELTPLTCPECHGALVRFKEGKLIRYRCHTGHAYTASALLSEVTQSVEEMMWSSIRGLDETVMLLEQSAQAFADAGETESADQFFDKAREVRERSRKIREMIFEQEQISEDQRFSGNGKT
ncbi:chemotaxis protein CheB [Fibrisoma montanum]|uniref:protein-glutamate methylesterase n=1 Tax=Fibrisoma montanum TaxID=2305895 RepID=A0A418M2F0_9BACT|nr:chemotaxis protein CheB [Fibrisoma montanum]RIV19854.1 chemotaxis protein CheB [Fibrisoma montanum]